MSGDRSPDRIQLYSELSPTIRLFLADPTDRSARPFPLRLLVVSLDESYAWTLLSIDYC